MAPTSINSSSNSDQADAKMPISRLLIWFWQTCGSAGVSNADTIMSKSRVLFRTDEIVCSD